MVDRAFGFQFDHTFGFYSKLTGDILDSPFKYELFADMGEGDARSVKRTKISEAFPAVGAKLAFLFDYGDEWGFVVEVIGQDRKKYPRLVKSVGEAPEQYPDDED